MEYHAIQFDLQKVETLKLLRDNYQRAYKAIGNLNTPLVTDQNHLGRMFEAYLNIFRRRGMEEKAYEVHNRKKFLFAVLYLYCPIALAGGKIKTGLRDRLSRLFRLNGSTSISDNTTNLYHLYRHYKDFRRDADLIFNEIVNALMADGYKFDV